MEDDDDEAHLESISGEVSGGVVAEEAAKKPSDAIGDLSGETKCPVSDRFAEVRESPPDDDCCPICFGDFKIPCRTSCGHWFCGACILIFWNHSSTLRPCKCPICSALITKFTPKASLLLEQDEKVVNTLKEVQAYNNLFVGGARGLFMKVLHMLLQMLLAIKEFFKGRWGLDQIDFNVPLARLIAPIVTFLYERCGFDFIPRGYIEISSLFEYTAMSFAVILYLYDFHRRSRARPVANPQI